MTIGTIEGGGPLLSVEQAKINAVYRALAHTGGNFTKACKILKVDRKTLYHWVRRHAELSEFHKEWRPVTLGLSGGQPSGD